MLDKIIFSVALLLSLAAGIAGVLTVQKQAAATKQPCVIGISCASVVGLPTVW